MSTELITPDELALQRLTRRAKENGAHIATTPGELLRLLAEESEQGERLRAIVARLAALVPLLAEETAAGGEPMDVIDRAIERALRGEGPRALASPPASPPALAALPSHDPETR